jgi:hypothetical protein
MLAGTGTLPNTIEEFDPQLLSAEARVPQKPARANDYPRMDVLPPACPVVACSLVATRWAHTRRGTADLSILSSAREPTTSFLSRVRRKGP